VWSVALQRECRLSAVRKRRDRALSTLLACRQTSTALRVLLVNDAEDDEEELREAFAPDDALVQPSGVVSGRERAKFQVSLRRYIPYNEASDVAG
jgi:hypothetical protein